MIQRLKIDGQQKYVEFTPIVEEESHDIDSLKS